MESQTECPDCGRTFQQRKSGRPAIRCPECRVIWRRTHDRHKPRPPAPTVVRSPCICVDCGGEFQPSATGRLPTRCGSCRIVSRAVDTKERATAWRAANRDRALALRRASYHRTKNSDVQLANRQVQSLKVYGLTAESFAVLAQSQEDRCAICGSEHRGHGKRLHVDHDHVTGKVRGLLCGPCNVSLGGFADNPDRLRKAAGYIEQHQGGPNE